MRRGDWREAREDRRELREDRRELREDRRDYREDRGDAWRDYRSRNRHVFHQPRYMGPSGYRYRAWQPGWRIRSEEHTSELQSLMRTSYAVFCLKKKKQTMRQ